MDARLKEMFPKSFDQNAWDKVKSDLRPLLAAAVYYKNWRLAARVWEKKRCLIEKAIGAVR